FQFRYLSRPCHAGRSRAVDRCRVLIMLSPVALRKWSFVHKWASLVSTVFLLMLCITGLPLIFEHEIEHWLNEGVQHTTAASGLPMANLDDVVAAAKAQAPD